MADGGLMGIDPDLLMNLGMGLLSIGGKNMAGQGNPGQVLQQSMGNYYGQKEAKQNLQKGALDIQTSQYGLEKTKQLLHIVGGLMGDPQEPAPSAPVNAPEAPPSASPVPMGPPQSSVAPVSAGMPSAAPQGMPSWLTPPTQQSIYSQPVGGYNPRALSALNILQGKDPVEALAKTREIQLKDAQQANGPTIAKLDTLVKSDSPVRYMNADPDLKSAWPILAQQRGMDPVKDLNDQNVRTAFTFHRNAIASSLSEPIEAPNVPEQDVRGPLNSLLQRNPVNNKLTQVRGEEELQQVVDPKTNQPVLMTKSQAVGKQPFNASLFGAANVTDQTKELMYQQWKATGQLPQGYARNPTMLSDLTNYIAMRAKQDDPTGNAGATAAATRQQYTARQGVVKDFESGQTGKALTAINTAVKHMDNLEPLIDALQNGNLTALNKFGNFFKEQTGSPAPTNYAAIKEFVGGEVAKAVLPGGGGEAERQALTAPLKAANSPEQLRQAVAQIRTALAGKTEALRNQWDVGTAGTQGDFNRFLLPETKKALGVTDAKGQSNVVNWNDLK